MFTPDLPVLTERLSLRVLEMGDLDLDAELAAIPEVVRYLYQDVQTREEAAGRLRRYGGRSTVDAEGDALSLAVDLRETGETIGHVVLVWTSEVHRSGEVGYIIHPRHAGRGYATEATRALLALGFQGLGLHRVTARADARNSASIRVMERAGMRREALFRENEWVKGEWTDEIACALLEDEWRALVAG